MSSHCYFKLDMTNKNELYIERMAEAATYPVVLT